MDESRRIGGQSQPARSGNGTIVKAGVLIVAAALGGTALALLPPMTGGGAEAQPVSAIAGPRMEAAPSPAEKPERKASTRSTGGMFGGGMFGGGGIAVMTKEKSARYAKKARAIEAAERAEDEAQIAQGGWAGAVAKCRRRDAAKRRRQRARADKVTRDVQDLVKANYRFPYRMPKLVDCIMKHNRRDLCDADFRAGFSEAVGRFYSGKRIDPPSRVELRSRFRESEEGGFFKRYHTARKLRRLAVEGRLVRSELAGFFGEPAWVGDLFGDWIKVRSLCRT